MLSFILCSDGNLLRQYTKMCVVSPHDSINFGESHVMSNGQALALRPPMIAQSEFKLFQIDRHTTSISNLRLTLHGQPNLTENFYSITNAPLA